MAKGKSKKPAAKKARMFKTVPDKASCSVTATLAASNANQIYSFDTIQLAQFQRAAGIAQYYQRFRIVGVTVTWKPVLDTYTVTPAGIPYAKPNLYYMVDKSGSIPDNVTLEGLKQAGAKVKVLDERPAHVSWKPSVLEENQAVIAGGATFAGPSGFKTSPYLSTNQNTTNIGAWQPNNTNHLGLKFYIEQAGNGTTSAAFAYPTEMTVEFEFIKPMIGGLVGAGSAMGLQFATIDASPDGVEGGSDGITIPLVAK